MNKQTITTLTILIATTLIIGGAVILKNENKLIASDDDAPKTSTSATGSTAKKVASIDPSTASTTPTSTYRNGTYSATGSYDAPDGRQDIGVTLIIDAGIVTGTSAQNKATGQESSQYEDQFIADYKGAVIGKKLSELNGLVSGDSLTLIGFEDAITQIQAQAKQ